MKKKIELYFDHDLDAVQTNSLNYVLDAAIMKISKDFGLKKVEVDGNVYWLKS
jgi:hypothetical protein